MVSIIILAFHDLGTIIYVRDRILLHVDTIVFLPHPQPNSVTNFWYWYNIYKKKANKLKPKLIIFSFGQKTNEMIHEINVFFSSFIYLLKMCIHFNKYLKKTCLFWFICYLYTHVRRPQINGWWKTIILDFK